MSLKKELFLINCGLDQWDLPTECAWDSFLTFILSSLKLGIRRAERENSAFDRQHSVVERQNSAKQEIGRQNSDTTKLKDTKGDESEIGKGDAELTSSTKCALS